MKINNFKGLVMGSTGLRKINSRPSNDVIINLNINANNYALAA